MDEVFIDWKCPKCGTKNFIVAEKEAGTLTTYATIDTKSCCLKEGPKQIEIINWELIDWGED